MHGFGLCNIDTRLTYCSSAIHWTIVLSSPETTRSRWRATPRRLRRLMEAICIVTKSGEDETVSFAKVAQLIHAYACKSSGQLWSMYHTKEYFRPRSAYLIIWFIRLLFSVETVTDREQNFTPGGEPPLVPVPHLGASIRD